MRRVVPCRCHYTGLSEFRKAKRMTVAAVRMTAGSLLRDTENGVNGNEI